MRSVLTLALLIATLLAPAVFVAEAGTPDPSALLLAPRDLPAGYVSDTALENADATARSHAYSRLIAASAFVGYRMQHAAVVQYVARLHRRTDGGAFLAGEEVAVDSARTVQRITLAAHYGDRADLAYQAHGARGETWVVALFADGPYITMLGSYDAKGEQAAIDTIQQLARLADARLRLAARHTPDPPAPRPRPEPPLRITTLATTTRTGHATDMFRPHSPLYWRVVWRVTKPPRGSHETLHEWVWHGKTILYRNGLTDRPFAGDNLLRDHLLLHGVAPGLYNVTVSVTVGRLSVRATHSFRVVVPKPRHKATS